MRERMDTNSDFPTLENDAKRYRIRAMTMTDLPIVVKLDRDTWGDNSWPIEQFYDYFDDSNANCWVLENYTTDNLIVGYGFQRVSPELLHITNLCVHPNERGRGLGGMLLRHMINYARWLNIPIVQLEVDTSNTRAYTLYHKHGFTIRRYLEQYYSKINDAYLMQLFIE